MAVFGILGAPLERVTTWRNTMDELEKQGVALVKQYGMLLRLHPPIRQFLIAVGARLQWAEFLKAL